MQNNANAQERMLNEGPLVLDSIVLAVEIRKCKNCRQEHRAPAGVYLRMKNPRGGKVLTQPRVNTLVLDLPRETQTVTSYVDACEECFQQSSQGISQGSLLDTGAKRKFMLVGKEINGKEIRELTTYKQERTRSNILKEEKADKEKKAHQKVMSIF